MSEAGHILPAARGGKSAGAFRTTSEVAAELDLPPHVLRFWETKFPQVRPLKRSGGRRYYRPEDVVLLRRIRRFLYQEGYTIKGVQKLLRDNAAEAALPEEPELPIAAPDKGASLRQVLEEVRRDLLDIQELLAKLSAPKDEPSPAGGEGQGGD